MRAAAIIVCGVLAVAFAADVRANDENSALTARELAIIVNTRDPLSVAIGGYYQRQRQVPAENVARIALDPTQSGIGVEEFEQIRARVLDTLPVHVQAYALTWAQPYRVACMSITTAFAAGFDTAFCGSGCQRTRLNPYYGSSVRRPYQQLGMRLAMSIAARDFQEAKALIERGIAAEDVQARGTAYLLRTPDTHRNVRASGYQDTQRMFEKVLPVRIENASGLQGRRDVMFYFIGAAHVPHLTTNLFLPGAVADHLTSLGGQLTDSSQMSSLRWLEAGATGSYGTVSEPCNFPGKFPSPALVMKHYLAGETLIEAYWKSVAMPGQGIFIGEPLARPFARGVLARSAGS